MLNSWIGAHLTSGGLPGGVRAEASGTDAPPCRKPVSDFFSWLFFFLA
jgi:hypothetical protein